MVIWYGSNRKLIQLSFYVTMYLDNFFTSVPVVVHCSFAHLRLILCELMDYSTSGFTVLLHLPAAAAKSLQSCLTLWDPIDGSPPGSPSLRFSRQEHWSGLPFPSPVHESEKWKGSRLVMSDSYWPHGLQPTRLLRPWDFPGKSTGVGCHHLLQCYILHIHILLLLLSDFLTWKKIKMILFPARILFVFS